MIDWKPVTGDEPKGTRMLVASKVPSGHFLEMGHLTIYGWRNDEAKPIHNVEYVYAPNYPDEADA